MGICRLCGEEKPLIKAHIVPAPFWPNATSGMPKLLTNTEGIFPRRAPIGVYDEEILCRTCDQTLGILDQKAAENLLQAKPVPLFGSARDIGYHYPNYQSDDLLSFVASVAWRVIPPQANGF